MDVTEEVINTQDKKFSPTEWLWGVENTHTLDITLNWSSFQHTKYRSDIPKGVAPETNDSGNFGSLYDCILASDSSSRSLMPSLRRKLKSSLNVPSSLNP